MMAYVLINVELECEREVLDVVRNIEGVKEAHALYGVYDIVAKVEAETMDKLRKTVTRKIRRLNKVRSTITMIVME
jgi:DNA-binding Lrp family transcriptional regulator